jgi:hypothetical protein
MKIILVIENEKGKNILFITNSMQSLTLVEALQAVQTEEIENTHTVRDNYIRSNPNKTAEDNLDILTISSHQLEKSLHNYDEIKDYPALQGYEEIRNENIKISTDVIFIAGCPRKTKSEVTNHLVPYSSLIIKAAQTQKIDPNLLGAILIDEYLRLGPDDLFDWAAKIGLDTSVGIAQVSIETARSLIKRGLYNPNPNDPKLEAENIDKTNKAYIYGYIKKPLHSVNLAAAKIRSLIEDWQKYTDISKAPAILGSLYSMYKKPHSNPEPNDRGRQIAGEFYGISEDILKNNSN